MPVPFIPMVEPKPHGSYKIRLDRAAIAQNFEDLEKHKWMLRERLDRDLDMHVAAVDYFENIRRREPASGLWDRFKTYGRQLLAQLLAYPYADNLASLIRFEQAMRGTRSLAH